MQEVVIIEKYSQKHAKSPCLCPLSRETIIGQKPFFACLVPLWESSLPDMVVKLPCLLDSLPPDRLISTFRPTFNNRFSLFGSNDPAEPEKRRSRPRPLISFSIQLSWPGRPDSGDLFCEYNQFGLVLVSLLHM
jgi:hypothetical protein